MRGCILEITIVNCDERIVITRIMDLLPDQVSDATALKEADAIINSLFVKPIKEIYKSVKVIIPASERIVNLL